MLLTIENLPRQTRNAKIQHFVVKIDGAEVGVIEKTPRYPFVGRLLGAVQEVGEFKDKTDAAQAVASAWKDCQKIA